MDKTIQQMREDAIKKLGKLDKNSLTLAYNTVTILQARQELEKGASDEHERNIQQQIG